MLSATFTLAGGSPAQARAHGAANASAHGESKSSAHSAADSSPRSRPGASSREESGFTTVELLVGLVVAVTVFTAALLLLASGQQVQARDAEWALVLQQDRAGEARMVRDIRQATEILEPATGAASSYIVFWATIGGKRWKVKYDCSISQAGTSYTECMRLAAEENASLPSTGPRVAVDVANASAVFSYTPTSRAEAKLVTVKLELPAKGTLKQAGVSYTAHKVVLEDAALIRNLCLSC
jgi:hypothetical protein